MATLGNTPRPAYVYDTETDTWVPIGVGAHTHDDLYVNQNVIDAKGDLLVGTADNSYTRLAKGADGTVLVADNTTQTGLAWQPYGAIQVAGRNKFFNGDFALNTKNLNSFPAMTYGFDRWMYDTSGGTVTATPQIFSAGNIISGYEPTNYLRIATTGQSAISDFTVLLQKIDDVRVLAGQTVTISFWAKATTGTPKVGVSFDQFFGDGGSATVLGSGQSTTISTTWQRYSFTFNLPSISGKTIGAGSLLIPLVWTSSGTTQGTRAGSIGIQNSTIDLWGMQLEAGSTATPFNTSSGNPQLETIISGSSGFDGILVSTNRISYNASYGSQTGTNGWAGYVVAGKNKIINGDFSINQRNATSTTSAFAFLADRWKTVSFSGSGTWSISTISYGSFAGQISNKAMRITSSSSSNDHGLQQSIEDVTTLAGQTVTVSFWIRSSGSTFGLDFIELLQYFGSGGSANVYSYGGQNTSFGSSWTRVSANISVPSVAGKTIGSGNYLNIRIDPTATIPNGEWIEITHIQLEAGPIATPFTTATGSIQGELAACQRYYVRLGGDSSYGVIGTGIMGSTTEASFVVPLPVTMRVAPTSIDFSTLRVTDFIGVNTPISSMSLTTSETTKFSARLYSSGLSGLTQYRPAFISNYNSSNGYLGFSAEL